MRSREDATHARQAADWPVAPRAPAGREGQAWKLGDSVWLIVGSEPCATYAERCWHLVLLLDDPHHPRDAGKFDRYTETTSDPWEDDADEPSWERVA